MFRGPVGFLLVCCIVGFVWVGVFVCVFVCFYNGSMGFALYAKNTSVTLRGYVLSQESQFLGFLSDTPHPVRELLWLMHLSISCFSFEYLL